jgi:DNA-binding protein HU-beta
MKDIELTTALAVRFNWGKEDVEIMLDALGEIIGEKLSQNDIISLHGLGQFESRKKAERISIIGGKRYLIPPKLVPIFRPSSSLKTYVKSLDNNHGQ